MRVAVFGGTGKTGQAVVSRLLEASYEVSALSRVAGKLNPKVKEVVGSLDSKSDIRNTLLNSDAAIIVIGPRPPYNEIFCERATKNIVSEMKALGLKRLFLQTGAMIGDYPKNLGFFFKQLKKQVGKSQKESMLDRAKQEKVVKDSGLDWVIIKPPRLTEGKAKGKYSFGETLKVGLMSSISRADIADFLIKNLFNLDINQEVVFIRD